MMGGFTGIWQWVIILVVVLILFGGRGKISALMGDFGKGLRNFKTGLKGPEADGDEEAAEAIEEAPKPAAKKAARKAAPKKAAAKKKAPAKKASAKKAAGK